jgi:hypothetical protein
VDDDEKDPGLRGAVKAALRAMSSPDPLTRVTAVSECLEFYAGRTKAEYDFTRAERRKLLVASQGFSLEKKRRVNEMVGALNTASLMRKLRVRLADDGVPITEGEMDTLWRVREQRNDLVHGRTDAVDQADLQQAMALLARIVVYASDRPSGAGLSSQL